MGAASGKHSSQHVSNQCQACITQTTPIPNQHTVHAYRASFAAAVLCAASLVLLPLEVRAEPLLHLVTLQLGHTTEVQALWVQCITLKG